MPNDDKFVAFPTQAQAQTACDKLDNLLEMPWVHPGRQWTIIWDEPYEDTLGRWIVTIERKLIDDLHPHLKVVTKAKVRQYILNHDLVLLNDRPARPGVEL